MFELSLPNPKDTNMTLLTLALLVIFQFKHLAADYPLQTPYMLKKFQAEGWQIPLAAHAGVHAAFTLAIAAVVQPSAWWVCLVDFVVHFAMDRVKASPSMLGRYKALSAAEFKTATPVQVVNNRYFWWSLGLDQTVHHLTDIFTVAVLVGVF